MAIFFLESTPVSPMTDCTTDSELDSVIEESPVFYTQEVKQEDVASCFLDNGCKESLQLLCPSPIVVDDSPVPPLDGFPVFCPPDSLISSLGTRVEGFPVFCPPRVPVRQFIASRRSTKTKLQKRTASAQAAAAVKKQVKRQIKSNVSLRPPQSTVSDCRDVVIDSLVPLTDSHPDTLLCSSDIMCFMLQYMHSNVGAAFFGGVAPSSLTLSDPMKNSFLNILVLFSNCQTGVIFYIIHFVQLLGEKHNDPNVEDFGLSGHSFPETMLLVFLLAARLTEISVRDWRYPLWIWSLACGVSIDRIRALELVTLKAIDFRTSVWDKDWEQSKNHANDWCHTVIADRPGWYASIARRFLRRNFASAPPTAPLHTFLPRHRSLILSPKPLTIHQELPSCRSARPNEY